MKRRRGTRKRETAAFGTTTAQRYLTSRGSNRVSSTPHRRLALRYVVIRHSDWSQEEPVTHPLPQPTRADHLDRAGSYASVPCHPAEPDGYHRAKVRRYVKIDGETGIEGAKIDGASGIHQPPQFLAFRDVGKFKLHRGAAIGKCRGIDALVNVPYQDGNVQIALFKRVLSIFQAPLAEQVERRPQRHPRLGEVPSGSTLAATSTLDDANAFQLLQALRQQSPRNQRYTATDIIEAGTSSPQLLNHQGCPPLSNEFGGLGEWAEQMVVHHGAASLMSRAHHTASWLPGKVQILDDRRPIEL